jgi:PAS domain S-box-containing protein
LRKLLENNSKTILLVEDEPLLAMMETRWLSRAGYSVIHVSTGEDAISHVFNPENKIDLILMDINLGSGIDGTEAAQGILKRNDIPLLFLSSHTEKEIVEKTEKITSYGYVVKDTKDVVLLASIKMAFKLYDANKKLKEKENALFKSQARLGRAELVSKSGNWELHLRTNKMTASEGAARIYGVKGGAWNIAEIQKIPLPEYRSVLDNAIKNLVEKDEPYDIEFKIRKADTGEILDIHSVAEYDKENKILFGIIRDVTKQKLEEKSLRESEENYRMLLDLAPDAFFHVDIKGSFIACNDNAVEITGYSKEQLLTMNIKDLFPETVRKERPLRYDLLTDGKTIKAERKLKCKNGEFTCVEMSSKLMPDNTYQSFMRDITGRKKDEEELINTKLILEQAFEQSPVPMILASVPDAVIRLANPASIEFLGMEDEPSTIGVPLWEINASFKDYNPGWEIGTVENLPLAKAMRGIRTTNEERIIIRKDNTVRWELVSSNPIYNSKGEIIAAYLIMNDITQRKEIENSLYESESTFRKIFEGSADPILIAKGERFLECNEAALTLLGIDNKNKILNASPADISPEYQPNGRLSSEMVLEHDEKARQNGNHRFEWMSLKHDGTPILLEVSLMPIMLKGEELLYIIWRDITERKSSEIALKQSEKKYRDLFEKSEDANLIIVNGKFVDCNRATVKLLCYNSKEELLNTHPSALSPVFQPGGKKSFDEANKILQLALDKGSHRFEWVHKKAGGEEFNVEVTLTAIDIENKILYTTWRDITERKQSELALYRSEEKYRNLVEKMPDGVYKSSHAGKFLEINSALVNMLGYSSKEELYAIDIKSQLYFQAVDRESTALEEKLEEIAIFRLKKKDGSEVWVEDHGRHVLDEEGNVLYHEGIMRDVSDRRKSELIKEALFNISEATYLSVEMDDLYKRIHEVISTLLSVKNFYIALYDEKEQMISFPYFVDEFDPPQPPKKIGKGLTEYVLRTGIPSLVTRAKFLELENAGEVELIGAPSPIWLGVPLKVEGKTIGVIVVQDYTNANLYDENAMSIMNYVSSHIAQIIERKRNSHEIIAITEELKKLNQTKDKFFSIISHDLKNAFHIINVTTKLLLDEQDSLSKGEFLKFLQGIYNTSEKTYSLFQNLLIWARAQSDNLEFNPSNFQLNEVITETIELMNENALHKNISIENNTEGNIWAYADKNMLETILRNLISNSIKFTGDSGKIRIGAKVYDDTIEIFVEDNGIGIPNEDIDKLFRIDQSYSTKGTRNEAGSGLGLILCNEFVKKHEGKIWVESEPERGSKLSFTIKKGE